MFLFVFIEFGTLWASWIYMSVSVLRLGTFSAIIFLVSSAPLLLWDHYNVDVILLDVPEVP